MKKTISLIAACIIVASLSIESVFCQSYNKVMTKAVKESLGKDFDKFSAFSYPTNNFGMITSFENSMKPKNQLCAMNRCLTGLDPLVGAEWIDLKGLADIGRGGKITLEQEVQNSLSISAVLPKLWNVLGISTTFDNNTIKKTQLDIGPGIVRYLNKLKFDAYIKNLPANDLYKKKFNEGNLVIITADVIVESLTATVEVDQTTAAKLDAKLDAGQLSKEFGNVELNFKMERTSQGKYTFVVSTPVIILRLARKQPSAGELGAVDKKDFETWPIQGDFISSESAGDK